MVYYTNDNHDGKFSKHGKGSDAGQLQYKAIVH